MKTFFSGLSSLHTDTSKATTFLLGFKRKGSQIKRVVPGNLNQRSASSIHAQLARIYTLFNFYTQLRDPRWIPQLKTDKKKSSIARDRYIRARTRASFTDPLSISKSASQSCHTCPHKGQWYAFILPCLLIRIGSHDERLQRIAHEWLVRDCPYSRLYGLSVLAYTELQGDAASWRTAVRRYSRSHARIVS